jgi:NitT/TauT family transport system ATP-binding protein
LQYATADRVVTAAWRLDLDVRAADRFMVLGPSGCGKSSLLKAVAGFLAPAEGSISLGGARVRGPGPDRIVVFQEFDQLLPWKTVADNVAFPLVAARGMGRKAARERARAELARVGLAGFADAYPHTLSGA